MKAAPHSLVRWSVCIAGRSCVLCNSDNPKFTFSDTKECFFLGFAILRYFLLSYVKAQQITPLPFVNRRIAADRAFHLDAKPASWLTVLTRGQIPHTVEVRPRRPRTGLSFHAADICLLRNKPSATINQTFLIYLSICRLALSAFVVKQKLYIFTPAIVIPLFLPCTLSYRNSVHTSLLRGNPPL